MFPILFVTVACGAVSGFHSLVSSGTSSKTVENEKDMLKVGYGAMILESLLAVLALCVAGAAAAADGTPAAGTPFQIFSRGVAGFFEMFGVPAYAATVFMTMCVSALALTSLDAVARIGRMSFQELFSVDDMEHAEGWRKLFCNVYFSTFLTLAFGFLLTKIGYANIWPLFGSANQLLSALVLATLCVFLKVTGRSNKMLFPPLIIMLRAYTFLGCHAAERDGVHGYVFRVWAPRAQGVSVTGDWNFWNTEDLPMTLVEYGIWEAFSAYAREGDAYKFYIRRRDGSAVYKSDPYAFRNCALPDTSSRICIKMILVILW